MYVHRRGNLSVGFDSANGEDTHSFDLEVNVQVFDLTGERSFENILELLGRPPVGGVARRAAVEISFLEVEVFFLARSAELRVLSVEIFKARSKGVLVPASDNEHTFWASAIEHLSETFFSNALRQDPKGVHAHAAQSEGGG